MISGNWAVLYQPPWEVNLRNDPYDWKHIIYLQSHKHPIYIHGWRKAILVIQFCIIYKYWVAQTGMGGILPVRVEVDIVFEKVFGALR